MYKISILNNFGRNVRYWFTLNYHKRVGYCKWSYLLPNVLCLILVINNLIKIYGTNILILHLTLAYIRLG